MSTATNDSTHSRPPKFSTIETAGSQTRRMGRRAVLSLLAGGLLWLFGCTTAFDGGTIPGGIRMARIFGQVVNAANPIQPIPNAQVSIATTPNTRATAQPVGAVTDANGAFDLSNVVAGTTTTQVQITIKPTDLAYRPETVTFDLPGGQPADLLIALVPASLPDTGSRVTLTPQAASVAANTPLAMKAQVFDAQGHPQHLLPNVLYIGSAGTLSTNGFAADGSNFTFNPLTPGAGTVTALWNGAVSSPALIQVTRPPSPPVGPPPPPTSTGQPKN